MVLELRHLGHCLRRRAAVWDASLEAHQGGYFDEIAVDPINLQPGDETIVGARLREELTRLNGR